MKTKIFSFLKSLSTPLSKIPVVESQGFFFICGGHFVLKEEDLHQNYLENYQSGHQTNGQAEKHKRKADINWKFCLLFGLQTSAEEATLQYDPQVWEHAQNISVFYGKNQ